MTLTPEEIEALKRDNEELRALAEASKHSNDRLIIRFSLFLIALFSVTLAHKAFTRDEYPSIQEIGVIAGSVMLLRSDRAQSTEITTGVLRRVLGVD